MSPHAAIHYSGYLALDWFSLPHRQRTNKLRLVVLSCVLNALQPWTDLSASCRCFFDHCLILVAAMEGATDAPLEAKFPAPVLADYALRRICLYSRRLADGAGVAV
ncbi:MAG: hypothetical protein SF069_03095 [Phycisphaerae bacterium]|nr:hypothetical protein [Phycisphaerae bacterium]